MHPAGRCHRCQRASPLHVGGQAPAGLSTSSPRLEGSALVVVLPLGARGKCLESFQLWRPSLAGNTLSPGSGEMAQTLVVPLWKRMAPDRTCSRILGCKHGSLHSKPCSQSQSRMLMAMLTIFHADDATTSLGTTPGLPNSCWSYWSLIGPTLFPKHTTSLKRAQAPSCSTSQPSMSSLCLPGLEKFEGQYLHSRDYKSPQPFLGKRVVVVGIGNSGIDIAVELSHTAKQVCWESSQGWDPRGHRSSPTIPWGLPSLYHLATSTPSPLCGGGYCCPSS